jgi:ATP-dependent Clp protease protease subunit
MIDRIKRALNSILNPGPQENLGKKIIVIDSSKTSIEEAMLPEQEMRTIGLFTDIQEEKIAELVHALLILNETNKDKDDKSKEPIEFYISTYGGGADDMFALYDIMRQVKNLTEIHTLGVGKVMSAGVLLLAAGTKGKRKIGKYCRVMLHSATAGSHGSLPNLMNEMEALQGLQENYIDALVAETNMTKTQIKKMLERKVNVYLSAEEAVEFGIADIII